MSGICSAHRHHEPGCPRCEPPSWWKARAEAAEARVAALTQTLRDFEKYGVRADLTPTRWFGDATEEARAARQDEYVWWCGYIGRADKQVRAIARRALRGLIAAAAAGMNPGDLAAINTALNPVAQEREERLIALTQVAEAARRIPVELILDTAELTLDDRRALRDLRATIREQL